MARPFTPSAAQIRALAALATYRMLNAALMQRLGVARDIGDVRDELRDLVRRRWVGQTEAHLISGVKRLPSLYWITPAGAAGAAGHGIEAVGSNRELGTEHEIEHRLAIVETHMALRAWAAGAGVAVNGVICDFDPTGPRTRTDPLRKVTAIGSFVPDMIAKVTPADGEPRLLVVEVERGGAAESLTRFRRKLPQLLQVCRDEVVENEFGVERAARFLILFQSRTMKVRALERWERPELPDWGQFFVKSLDELDDFAGGWSQPSGVVKPLF